MTTESKPSAETVREQVTRKICKAVPGIETGEICYLCDGMGTNSGGKCGHCNGAGRFPFIREITLEDVLIACYKAGTAKAPYFDIAAPLLGAWEMGKPLSQQKLETQSFINSILPD